MKKSLFFILLAAVLLLPMAALAATVNYIDENGIEQSHDCIIMTSQDNYAFESDKWYAVIGNVTIQERIENKALLGTPAHLILADGARLNASKGIHNSEGKELIICGQKNCSGELDINNPPVYSSGIGGNLAENGGTLTINGGRVVTAGAASASAIGGGQRGNGGIITVNGGEVHAKSGPFGAGIGGGGGIGGECGFITINSGSVYAEGGERGAGIGGGMGASKAYGSVTINGGIVTASGGDCAAGIGGGWYAEGVAVTINGGKVIATGGNAASGDEAGAGIGGGCRHRDTGAFVLNDRLSIYAGDSFAEITVTTASHYKSERGQYVQVDKGTPYTVSHYLQTADGTGYELKESETLYGLALLNTAAKAKQYDGFTPADITQKSIDEDGTTVVAIKYDRNFYNVNFVPYHCAGPEPISARYGSEATVDAESLSAPGYIFNGWYADEACTQEFVMPQTISMPAYDVTIYAGWTAMTDTPYTVKYYEMNISGDEYVLRETLPLTGCTGTDTAAEAPNRDGFTVKPFSQKKIAGDGSTVVEIYYDRNRYTITFDANGHGTAPASITAYFEQNVSAPQSPKQDGEYVFYGWFEDRDYTLPYTFSVMPLNGKTLYAGWKKFSNIAVSFNTMCGTYVDTQVINTGEKAMKPAVAPTREGYTFGGWYTDSAYGTEFDFNKAINSNTVVYAKWTKNASAQYTVTWKLDDTSVIDTTTVNAGEMPVHDDAEKTGYIFTGWTPALAPVTGDITYTAKFAQRTPEKAVVSFDTVGGTYVDTQLISIGEKATKPAANPTREDYTFVGWYTDSAYGTEFDFSKAINSNTVVYAKWNSIPPDAARLCRIEISNPPAKTVYEVGESFNQTGMVITAYYNDNTSAIVSSYQIINLHPFTSEDMDVTIRYTENSITREVRQAIRVKSDPSPVPMDLYGIVITTPPNRTTYAEGESFNPTGMVVNALYARPITNYSLTPFSNLIKTDTAVTVSYTENGVTKAALQPITVGPVKKPYKIIAGASQVVLTTANSAVFSSNADFGKFVRVEVDGRVVASKYYTAKSGSTVITFIKEFISQLKEGKHTLRIVSTDGNASTDFTVTSLPKTGDNTNPTLLLTLLLASMGTLLLVFSKAKKRNED